MLSATAFRRYSEQYVADGARARAGKLRLWAANFVSPEEYRAAERGETAPASASVRAPARRAVAAPTSLGCVIKGNRNRRGQWIYHLPGMPYYDQTRPGEIFCTEAEAQAAGYRRAIGR